MLEKTLESPLDFKEIQPVHPKGNQSWIFIGRTDAEAETPILWPLDSKNWLTGKDHDARKNWRQEEEGTTEDKIVGWHHQLDGHEFEHGTWQWTGKPGVLQSTQLQRVRHDWVTELADVSAFYLFVFTVVTSYACKCFCWILWRHVEVANIFLLWKLRKYPSSNRKIK